MFVIYKIPVMCDTYVLLRKMGGKHQKLQLPETYCRFQPTETSIWVKKMIWNPRNTKGDLKSIEIPANKWKRLRAVRRHSNIASDRIFVVVEPVIMSGARGGLEGATRRFLEKQSVRAVWSGAAVGRIPLSACYLWERAGRLPPQRRTRRAKRTHHTEIFKIIHFYH